MLFDSTHPICWLVLGKMAKGCMESTGSGLLARNLFGVNPELKLNVTHAQDQKCEHALLNQISEKRIVRFSKRSKVFLGNFC